MPMRAISNTFNRGELDPALYSRDDIDVYTKGAQKLRNMISLWTGAARIAPGTLYTDIMVDRENANAIITNSAFVKGFDFFYDATDNIIYTIVLRQSNAVSAFDIYFDNVLKATVIAPYTNAQIADVHAVAGHDRILFLHERVPMRQLIRGADHVTWTLSVFTPSINATFDYSTVGLATVYRVAGFTFTLGAVTGTGIALNASSAVFTANHVGGLFVGNGGVAKITAVGSTTTATVTITDDFTAVSVPGVLASLQEVMWTSGGGAPAGADRGFPARGVFYLNRLMLGRSYKLKNIVAVSTAGVYDNFDFSIVDALAAFSVSFNGKGDQTIQSMIADDSIIFLTSNKVFAQSPLVETPLSALTVYFAPQTQSPAANFEAVTIDNQALYSAANKSEVMQIIYRTNDAKYVSVPASMLSSHLFEQLNSNATWEPEGITARLYLATQENGTMLMYSTLLEQNVSAWSLRTTRGNYLQAIGDGRQIHTLVKRQINLGQTTFETNLDYAYLTDPNFDAFYDVQAAFANALDSTSVLVDQYDYILMGNDIPFTAIDITLGTISSANCGLTFEYLDGNGFWDSFTPTDNTTGLTASGSITWTFASVLNWQPYEVAGVEDKYWMRIRRNTETIVTTPTIDLIEVNTGDRIYLEKMMFEHYTDSTKEVTSDANGDVTGLTHLAGHQIYVIENGATSGPFFVSSTGTVNIESESATVNAGIQYKPLLVPMPLFVPTQMGDNMYAQKYVQDLFIDYVDSLYLKAGIGQVLTDIPSLTLGDYRLGSYMEPQTGIFAIQPRGDWEPRQQVVITQSQPGPMTIIGVGYHVEVT